MKIPLHIVVAAFAIASLTVARGGPASLEDDSLHSSGTVVHLAIRTNAPGGKLFIDDVFVGLAPMQGIPLPSGRHVVRCAHPDTSRWPQPVLIDTLDITGIDSTMEKTFDFPSLFYITSDPFGAAIILDDSVIGTTPLYYSATPAGQIVTFSREGYEQESVVFPGDGGMVYARLRPADGNTNKNSPLMASGERSKNLTPVLAATYGTIVAGGVAAYFKIRADESYNEYLAGGSPGALDRVHAYDKYSAVALVVSQLSFVALSYLLLSR